jgi:hypothetical protein
MSFADPQSITVNAVAQSLPEVGSKDGGKYRKDDGTLTLKILHQEGKRNRRTVRLDFQKIAANPYDNDRNQNFSGSVYIVMDAPVIGFTNQEIADYVAGLTDWLTEANALKVLGGQT